MDLSSRWDRSTGFFCILSALVVMAGCQAMSTGGSSVPPKSGALVVVSANLDFGTAVVGSSRQLSDTLTNGTLAAVTISGANSSDPSFVVTGPATPFALAPGQSPTITVKFTPRAAGKPAGGLSITSNAASGGVLRVTLSGTAVAAGTLAVNPSALSFGSVGVGQSAAKTATLTNPGASSVTVSQASVSNAAFSISGLTLPVTLGANQSTAFTVTFAPKSSGAVSGSITVNGDASLTMGTVAGSASASDPITASLPVAGAGTPAGQLGAAPAALAFGSVPVGSTQSQNVTLSNSGGSSTTISQAIPTGAGVRISGLTLPLTLSSGQSSTFQVTFAPTSAGSVTGSLAIVSSASNANLGLSITGTAGAPGALAVAPLNIGFGNVQVGSSQSQPASITNSGGTAVTITQAAAAGTGFSVSGLTLPLVLAVGQSAAFSVTFAPQSSGSANGSVAISGSGASATVALSGTGQAATTLGANPASISFGSVQVGAHQPQTVTLNNGSGSAITITQALASGTGFSMSGLSLPATLNPGQSTSFTASFTPSAAGSTTGSITITSNASNPSFGIPLSGTGVTAGALAANPTSIAFGSVPVGS